jgi:Tetratricopeptide repeat
MVPDLFSCPVGRMRYSGQPGRLSDLAAEAMYRELLHDQERVLGPDHAATLATRNDLAWTIECLGRYREAETMLRRLLTDEQQLLGEHHGSPRLCTPSFV